MYFRVFNLRLSLLATLFVPVFGWADSTTDIQQTGTQHHAAVTYTGVDGRNSLRLQQSGQDSRTDASISGTANHISLQQSDQVVFELQIEAYGTGSLDARELQYVGLVDSNVQEGQNSAYVSITGDGYNNDFVVQQYAGAEANDAQIRLMSSRNAQIGIIQTSQALANNATIDLTNTESGVFIVKQYSDAGDSDVSVRGEDGNYADSRMTIYQYNSAANHVDVDIAGDLSDSEVYVVQSSYSQNNQLLLSTSDVVGVDINIRQQAARNSTADIDLAADNVEMFLYQIGANQSAVNVDVQTEEQQLTLTQNEVNASNIGVSISGDNGADTGSVDITQLDCIQCNARYSTF